MKTWYKKQDSQIKIAEGEIPVPTATSAEQPAQTIALSPKEQANMIKFLMDPNGEIKMTQQEATAAVADQGFLKTMQPWITSQRQSSIGANGSIAFEFNPYSIIPEEQQKMLVALGAEINRIKEILGNLSQDYSFGAQKQMPIPKIQNKIRQPMQPQELQEEQEQPQPQASKVYNLKKLSRKME